MAPQRTTAEQHHQAAAASGDGPAARTPPAAAQQQHQATADLAWPLLLQHDSISTQLPLACKLLCCNKALAAAVAEHCAGQLDVPRFRTHSRAEQAVPWLRKHARLVRSLDVQAFNDSGWAAALMAVGPQTLALESLAIEATHTTLPLLEQLPASRLTHLALCVDELPPDWPAFVARMSAALGRLTALCSLALSKISIERPQLALSWLSALTRLTALSFEGPLSDLQHAPPQLLELQLNTYCGQQRQQQPLDLCHLAAATALTVSLSMPVDKRDVLPPNLLRLRLVRCRSVQPLLPLVQLQDLRLGLEGDITADQLRQLSRLTALRLDHVGSPGHELASAGAWPLLPLRRLELTHFILSAGVCQQLAQLSGLTSLALDAFELPQPDSAQQLATALRQLSGLQQLRMVYLGLNATIGKQHEVAGMRQLVQAVGSLDRLRELCISSKLAAAAAAAAGANSSSLAALTALTGLSLSSGCDVPDAAVAAIVSQLPGLQCLDCSWNPQLTDEVLPGIGRLQQLTKLSLQGTAVSDAGLQHLAGLTRLQSLNVYKTGLTDAGMCQLTGLTRLQELGVPWRVTAEQCRWLKQQLPLVALFNHWSDT